MTWSLTASLTRTVREGLSSPNGTATSTRRCSWCQISSTCSIVRSIDVFENFYSVRSSNISISSPALIYFAFFFFKISSSSAAISASIFAPLLGSFPCDLACVKENLRVSIIQRMYSISRRSSPDTFDLQVKSDLSGSLQPVRSAVHHSSLASFLRWRGGWLSIVHPLDQSKIRQSTPVYRSTKNRSMRRTMDAWPFSRPSDKGGGG